MSTTPETKTETTPTSPAAPASLTTYEDCIALLDAIKDEKDVGNLQSAFSKLRGFFTARLGKRKAEKGADGGDAVKSAISGGRTFKPYEPRPITPPEHLNSNPWK